ncbi:MAG: TRAP transporter small permease subunit [Burkholderiaceae bacterium]|nr:TRAP transporter small permease subunit [Burkholderiaceae bacterium]
MRHFLTLSRAIDAGTSLVGRVVYWLILVAVLISAGNAILRYSIGYSSNASLEMQWYLSSAVFLLCAGYAMLHQAHVRIDLISGRFSARVNAWVDVFGIIVMVLPVCAVITVFGWDAFVSSYQIGEVSLDAGGLLRWPVKLLIPIGFALLIVQAISELIKKIAFLRGLLPATGNDGGNDAGAATTDVTEAPHARP